MKCKVKIKRRLIWLLLCIMLMLICAGFTSPLYPHYIGNDTAIFLTIARAVVNGKVPYAGIFDHKGPFFFWIYAAGYFFGGRNGVFLLQCILLFVDMLLIERIAGLFRAEPHTLFLPFFALFFYMFEHGGLTEEFSMPLILAGMYFELRFLVSGKEKHAPGTAFFYGILLGILAFIRLNNAITVCALLLGIIFVLIRQRQWTNLFVNLICGLLGIAAVTAPVCIYFYVHGALYDMLYGTFLFNLVYAKSKTHYPILSSAALYYLILLLPGVYAIGIFWKKWRKGRNRTYGALLLAAVLTYGMLAYSNVYLHYFVLGIPLVIVATAAEGGHPFAFLRDLVSRMMAGTSGIKTFKAEMASFVLTGITAVYLLLSGLSACAPVYKTYLTDIARREYEQVQEGVSVIPEGERGDVIAYCVPTSFYFHADILPCYRFFVLQKWHSTEKVNVNQEFMTFLEKEHPLWVIISAEEENKMIRNILDDSYICRRSDEKYSYYRYRDSKP